MDSLKMAAIISDSAKQKNPNSVSQTTALPTTTGADNTPKNNDQIWKQFIDEYSNVIKTEVLPSKKIKKGTYSIYIDYAIETDGSVSTVNIVCIPENSYLVEQIKTRMMANTPQLNPVLMSNGKPRKTLKKQVLTFVKDKD
jgi:hypothetical protein